MGTDDGLTTFDRLHLLRLVALSREAEVKKETDTQLSAEKKETWTEQAHPHYSCAARRLATFDTWPKFLKPSPESMVSAGFFYSGEDDHVICFACGTDIRGIHPIADPQVEHAKHSPKCWFVTMSYHGSKEYERLQRIRILHTVLEKLDSKTGPPSL